MADDDFSWIGNLFSSGTPGVASGTGDFGAPGGAWDVSSGGTPAGALNFLSPSTTAKQQALSKGLGTLGAGALKGAAPVSTAPRAGAAPLHQPAGGDQLAQLIQTLRQRQQQRAGGLAAPGTGGLLGNF